MPSRIDLANQMSKMDINRQNMTLLFVAVEFIKVCHNTWIKMEWWMHQIIRPLHSILNREQNQQIYYDTSSIICVWIYFDIGNRTWCLWCRYWLTMGEPKGTKPDIRNGMKIFSPVSGWMIAWKAWSNLVKLKPKYQSSFASQTANWFYNIFQSFQPWSYLFDFLCLP